MPPQKWPILSSTFTVEHLMTPRDQLNIWDLDKNSGQFPIFAELEFDIVPVIQNGEITSVLEKENKTHEQLSHRWLISRDTSIPDLLEYFIQSSQKAFLVLHGREVIGLVSPADLNKLPARAYIYHLIGELEMSLAEFARLELGQDEERVYSYLSNERKIEIISLHNRLSEGNAEVDIIQFLYLSELFGIVEKDEILRSRLGFTSRNQANKQFSGMNELRKKIMHLVGPLLEKVSEDLKKLQARIHRAVEILDQLATA